MTDLIAEMTLAEGMVLVTNVITIVRLYRLQRKYPGFAPDN